MHGTIREVVGNLAFTTSGDVWAVFRLQGIPAGFGGNDNAEIARKLHLELFTNLKGGEGMLLGLSSAVDAAAVVARMLDSTDPSANPEWFEEARHTLAALKDRDDLGGSEYFLAIPLPATNVKARVRTTLSAYSTQLRDLLALPVQVMGRKEAQSWATAADAVFKKIPAPFRATKATLAELLWIHARNVSRGRPAREYPPAPIGSEQTLFTEPVNTRRAFPWQLEFDEGGRTDKAGSPLKNRYVKITDVDAGESTYQACMYLASTPSRGWPDLHSWFHNIDLIGLEADWCIRFTITPAQQELQKAKRSERILMDQANQQQSSSIVAQTGGAVEVGYRALADYVRALKVTDDEHAIRASIIVALAAPSAAEVEDKVQHFTNQFASAEYRWDRPIGGQEHAWTQFMPGNATNQLSREFEQPTTVRQFATVAPLVSRDLGDPTGFVIAENQSSGTNNLVFLDLFRQVGADKSPACGFVGEPGAGKSTAIKMIIANLYRRGNRFVVIDPTAAKEYWTFVVALTDPVVADLGRPTFSLDPLRLFGAERGYAESLWLLRVLTGMKKKTDEYRLIQELLRKLTTPTLANLLTFLKLSVNNSRPYGRFSVDILRNAFYLLDEFASTVYGGTLFDHDLPVLPMDANAIVFLTSGLKMPLESELQNPNTYEEMPTEKLFGRAMYALVFKLSRIICYSNPYEFAACVFDEAHTVMHDDASVSELDVWIRDGRKHSACLLLGSQDAADFGGDTLAGLIQNRFVFRQTDSDLARRNLAWIERDFGADEFLVKMVTEDLSPLGLDGKVPPARRGEAIFRDNQGRVGRIRILIPNDPTVRDKVLSTPSESTRTDNDLDTIVEVAAA